MQGPSETILKARLRRDPPHPRALTTLLEAMALWQGRPVRAALAADDAPTSSDSCHCPSAYLGAETTALYTVAWVPVAGAKRRRRGLAGLGEFGDLERLLLAEVAR
jgi:hypothetical protein